MMKTTINDKCIIYIEIKHGIFKRNDSTVLRLNLIIRRTWTDKNVLIIIIEMMTNNNKHNRHLKVIIRIGIQLCQYGINQHIIVISITFWIKSRLIIIIKKIRKLIKLQKLQSRINTLINIKQYQSHHY